MAAFVRYDGKKYVASGLINDSPNGIFFWVRALPQCLQCPCLLIRQQKCGRRVCTARQPQGVTHTHAQAPALTIRKLMADTLPARCSFTPSTLASTLVSP